MKTNYQELKENLNCLTKDEAKDYLEHYFKMNSSENYLLESEVDEDSREAVELLFNSFNLTDGVKAALEKDVLNKEALLVSSYFEEDVLTYSYFENMRAYLVSFEDMSLYKKEEIIEDYDLYTDFLTALSSIKMALSVKEEILKYKEPDWYDISKIALLYSLLENGDKLKELIDNYPQADSYVYLLTLVTLLKEKKEIEAIEVFSDFRHDYPQAEYLDHMWDLDDSNEENREFIESVEDCIETICSVPYFFSWCAEHKNSSLKS